MTETKRCQAIVAQFAWFSQQCVNEATGTTRVPDWPFDIPVCDDHQPYAANLKALKHEADEAFKIIKENR